MHGKLWRVLCLFTISIVLRVWCALCLQRIAILVKQPVSHSYGPVSLADITCQTSMEVQPSSAVLRMRSPIHVHHIQCWNRNSIKIGTTLNPVQFSIASDLPPHAASTHCGTMQLAQLGTNNACATSPEMRNMSVCACRLNASFSPAPVS